MLSSKQAIQHFFGKSHGRFEKDLTLSSNFRLEEEQQKRLISKLPVYYPGISGCRNVAEFECLNRIEEGTFGVVYRAKEKKTGSLQDFY